jgi:hypothetical protein
VIGVAFKELSEEELGSGRKLSPEDEKDLTWIHNAFRSSEERRYKRYRFFQKAQDRFEDS